LPHITDGRPVDLLEPGPFSFAGPYDALGAIIEIWAALPWELALQLSQKLDFCAETFDFAELVKNQRQGLVRRGGGIDPQRQKNKPTLRFSMPRIRGVLFSSLPVPFRRAGSPPE
jgi:hypothetical protein